MASQKITNTRMTHKDGKPRKKPVREMMEEAPDEASKREIERLADKMEQM